jgi:hypothetical protein
VSPCTQPARGVAWSCRRWCHLHGAHVVRDVLACAVCVGGLSEDSFIGVLCAAMEGILHVISYGLASMPRVRQDAVMTAALT